MFRRRNLILFTRTKQPQSIIYMLLRTSSRLYSFSLLQPYFFQYLYLYALKHRKTPKHERKSRSKQEGI
jgi:hypothetical protein